MKRKRDTSDEERALFHAVMRDASVLTETAGKPGKASVPVPKPQPARPRNRPTGVDGKTAERLRKGAIEPDARLDLHGLTENTAHRALVTFLRGAASRGARLTLVITGKGAKAETLEELFDPPARGILKSAVPRWLQEPDLARFVADVRTAHRRHGGAGALYVYLRKTVKPA
ncbi:MAG TPA: Smr/MutS family protein [Rhizomicrobium sp.]|nr:Smr/MutS family protein [Rhizomicrobium sp.]